MKLENCISYIELNVLLEKKGQCSQRGQIYRQFLQLWELCSTNIYINRNNK